MLKPTTFFLYEPETKSLTNIQDILIVSIPSEPPRTFPGAPFSSLRPFLRDRLFFNFFLGMIAKSNATENPTLSDFRSHGESLSVLFIQLINAFSPKYRIVCLSFFVPIFLFFSAPPDPRCFGLRRDNVWGSPAYSSGKSNLRAGSAPALRLTSPIPPS